MLQTWKIKGLTLKNLGNSLKCIVSFDFSSFCVLEISQLKLFNFSVLNIDSYSRSKGVLTNLYYFSSFFMIYVYDSAPEESPGA